MRVAVAKFTVDTKLFRELGEMLVGRESTAIVELVKNAYDADATVVLLEAHNLSDAAKGTIQIADNGVGMTRDEFEKGFLTIASRSKTTGERRSAVFGRRFTGEKGVGRLALHKLATRAHIRSIKWNDGKPTKVGLPTDGVGVAASIDWDEIERLETFDEIEGSDALEVDDFADPKVNTAGTEINLAGLRREWTKRMRDRFYEDVATLIPPKVLVEELPSTVVDGPLLFPRPKVRDQVDEIGGFDVTYAGELEAPEALLPNAADRAGWIIEIDCDAEQRTIRYAILPSKAYLRKRPNATPFQMERMLADDDPRVSFHSRVLTIEDDSWPTAFQGVRIYMEGFRVQPYGERNDDWLLLGSDYRRRGRSLMPYLGRDFDDVIAGADGEFLTIRTSNSYYGGVFFTQNRANSLKMLVNREGFLPNIEFEFVRRTVRVGLDLLVRVRYSVEHELKQARRDYKKKQERAERIADSRELPTSFVVRESIGSATQAVQAVRSALARNDVRGATAALENAKEPLESVAELVGELTDEAKLFRINAAIGTEMAAFVHEINGLVSLAITVTQQLETLRSSRGLSREQARLVKAAHETASDLRHAVERQAAYLRDMTSSDARRRRSRQLLRQRFDSACRLIESASVKRHITINNEISEEIRTRPMFPAEVTALFSNLLTNAVKAAGDHGRIRALAWIDEQEEALVCAVENTGVAVDLATSDQWFEPFRSTTADVEAALGQGMGLGLTIARSAVQEYGGSIKFVKPSEGYATRIEFRLPQ